jgi:hypothetical protein
MKAKILFAILGLSLVAAACNKQPEAMKDNSDSMKQEDTMKAGSDTMMDTSKDTMSNDKSATDDKSMMDDKTMMDGEVDASADMMTK